MDFFSSDVAVAIAWICGIAGFIFGIVQKAANHNLRIQLQNSQSLVQTLTNSSSSTDNSRNEVSQNGEKNVYTKQNSGGMNIRM